MFSKASPHKMSSATLYFETLYGSHFMLFAAVADGTPTAPTLESSVNKSIKTIFYYGRLRNSDGTTGMKLKYLRSQ